VPPTSGRASEIIVIACAPIQGKTGFGGILAAVIRINHFIEVVSSIRLGETVSTSLGTLGYAVSAFTDSAEVLQAFEKDPGRFDILITDNLMAHRDGFQIATRMRELRPDLPIVLCSSSFSPDAEEQARSIGIQQLLAKPLSTHQLAAAIRKALAARAST
jgi:CheY-like chemotaxis protein